jgi:hypothetical protein
VLQDTLRRFYAVFKSEKPDPKYSFGRPCLASRRSSVKQHLSGQRGYTVWIPINVKKLRTVHDCICPDVMATRPDTLQSSRIFQHSSASVWNFSHQRWIKRLINFLGNLKLFPLSFFKHSSYNSFLTYSLLFIYVFLGGGVVQQTSYNQTVLDKPKIHYKKTWEY